MYYLNSRYKDGHKLIKDIKVGDKVYSENPETGEKGLKKVKNVYIHETDTLIHVMIGDAEIKTTPTHPFWVVGNGWVEAGKLIVEDNLLLSSGETAKIESINIEYLKQPMNVYNFEVEDWHTYFVSDENVLVHNTCMRGIGGKGWRGDKLWKSLVNTINDGGTIKSLGGIIPNEKEVIDLITESGGKVLRIEAPHEFPNPHDFYHINYETLHGSRGTIRIPE